MSYSELSIGSAQLLAAAGGLLRVVVNDDAPYFGVPTHIGDGDCFNVLLMRAGTGEVGFAAGYKFHGADTPELPSTAGSWLLLSFVKHSSEVYELSRSVRDAGA